MGSLESLTFPKKSHRKEIILPEHSEEFAEFFGILMGDGGINNPWQAKITLNSIADNEYSKYVANLGEKLFGIAPAIRLRKGKQALEIVFSSISLVDFLVTEGLPRGNKLAGDLCIPAWILENPLYVRSCVRGLVDTDGCLYIHVHTVAWKEYRNLGFCFTSHSSVLIAQVASIFEEYGIMPHISGQGQDIFLYRKDAVSHYIQIFGTSNERIDSVYRKFGGVA